MRCDRGRRVHSRGFGSILLVKSSCRQEKLLPKMSSETDSTDGCSSHTGPSLLHLPHSCCSCDDNHQSDWPTGQQPPLLHSGVECVRTGAALKGVTATTQDGCENVWRKKPSAGERGSVCSCMHTGVWAPAGGIYHSNIVLCCNVSLCHQKIICPPQSSCLSKQTHLNSCSGCICST